MSTLFRLSGETGSAHVTKKKQRKLHIGWKSLYVVVVVVDKLVYNNLMKHKKKRRKRTRKETRKKEEEEEESIDKTLGLRLSTFFS